VHPDVTLPFDQRPDDLAGQRGGDLVPVQALQRDVAFAQPERLPGGAPERDRLARVGELAGRGLAEQFGTDAQQPVDEFRQLVPAGAEPLRDLAGVVLR